MDGSREAKEDIIHAVARLVGLPCGQVTRSSSLQGDLGLDAFDAVELIDELEQLYDTELPEALHQPERVRRSVQTVEDIERALARGEEMRINEANPREVST